MTEQHDKNTSETPRNWDRYARMLRRLPQQQLPNGFTARLDAAVRRRGAGRKRSGRSAWWVAAPTITLAALIVAIWAGSSPLVDTVSSRPDSAVSAVHPTTPSKSRRNHVKRSGSAGRTMPVIPLVEPPAPPAVAAAPASLDSMIRELHQTVGRGAVTGMPKDELAPGSYYPRGAVAVLMQ